MRSIIIISKVNIGISPGARVGINRKGLNIFKKTLSTSLKDNLKEKLIEENMDYNVEVDNSYDNCENIIKKGVNLLLISPYIKDKIDIKNINKKYYYILSEKEFNEGYVEDIIEYLKQYTSN
ncbi:hypothetical protein JCM1393_20240 [Clostridium carnis]